MKDLRLRRHLCTLHMAQLLESRGQSENPVAEKLPLPPCGFPNTPDPTILDQSPPVDWTWSGILALGTWPYINPIQCGGLET